MEITNKNISKGIVSIIIAIIIIFSGTFERFGELQCTK
jgi:hypothetical protein